jgi:NADPH:quinone reductase-like Zn-dependent oxidoreductase
VKAVVVTAYEKFEIGDLPVPHAGPGQIQVRVAAASINPLDVRLPRGDFRDHVPLTFPHVPGNDFAGTVTEVGEGVTAYRIGDEVFGHAVPYVLRPMAGSSRPSMSTGSLAQFAVFEADTPFIAHRPESLDVEQAAALPTVGLIARALMTTAAIKPGEKVLVVGATGGVGTTVLPLLAAAGAHVIATATAPGEIEVRETIEYGAYPPGVDVAFNLVLPSDGLADVAAAVKPGGRLYTITFPVPQNEWIRRDDIVFELVLDMDGRLGGMAEVAALHTTIDRSYPFEEALQALADFTGRHKTGKLVVRI